MLGLKLPTDPRWVDLAKISLEDILTDHAYCEQKAATFCISLIQQFPDKIKLVEEVSPVVTEEWGHFRMVLAELQRRGLKLGFQRKDEYVNLLNQFVPKGGSRESRLIEKLLVCALIEARSCERFRLLSTELEDEGLRDFYHKFMVSEAGHYRMFLGLARNYGGTEKVNDRWQDYLDYEVEIMKKLELRGDRMH
ncbi:tRNA-(ms[2]io[6]A)-hydroxylase [Membranihabitans maritimus]|uniref:tRNA-(ms[2]io[6]A)-hydroxylase n=1 Tax=Membranihabitans maritimus TaxID=2904244 RepID=UPI001F27E075|nr:tRNA-(ms[2]io[6]A)-hydroxylase [Membranihabitans maritimus]